MFALSRTVSWYLAASAVFTFNFSMADISSGEMNTPTPPVPDETACSSKGHDRPNEPCRATPNQNLCPIGGKHEGGKCYVMAKVPESLLFFHGKNIYYGLQKDIFKNLSPGDRLECKWPKSDEIPKGSLEVRPYGDKKVCLVEITDEYYQDIIKLTLSPDGRVFYPARRQFKTRQGFDLYGYDYENRNVCAFEECEERCTFDPKCKAFTFVPEDQDADKGKGSCWLKYRMPRWVILSHAISGRKEP
jgi:hypothetical protein